MHLILPFAASHALPASALQGLALPRLRQHLAGLLPSGDVFDPQAQHPLMPHERAHAQALGWPADGPWPFAALALQAQDATPTAWLTPCHWRIGMDRVHMLAPAALGLGEDESQALLQAVQPWLAQDGLQAQWHDALHWRVQGPLLQAVCGASLARVSAGGEGVNIRPWITDGRWPPALLRLQSEVQMLLYPHPVNEAREARGLPTVNAFWLHGAGALPPLATPTATATPSEPVRCLSPLQPAALRGDATAWRAAWQALDAELAQMPALTALTLCSETRARTWRPRPRGLLHTLAQRLRPQREDAALHSLLEDVA